MASPVKPVISDLHLGTAIPTRSRHMSGAAWGSMCAMA
jgi:hypothetical protein